MIPTLAGALMVVMGLVLGLLGGGGSILAVPILLYAAGMATKQALATSLLIVSLTSLAALAPHAKAGNVDWRTGLVFGAVAMLGGYLGGRLAAFVPSELLLGMFIGVMALTALMMLRPSRHPSSAEESRSPAPLLAMAEGFGVGVFTGLVGAGGGFVVVPTLVLLNGLSMRRAIGTSLLVISMKSAAALAGYGSHVQIDWGLAAPLSAFALVGAIGGALLSARLPQARAKQAFGVLVLILSFLMAGQRIYAL